MPRTFMVSIDGSLSDREAAKVVQSVQKSLAKWFKKGHGIKVEQVK